MRILQTGSNPFKDSYFMSDGLNEDLSDKDVGLSTAKKEQINSSMIVPQNLIVLGEYESAENMSDCSKASTDDSLLCDKKQKCSHIDIQIANQYSENYRVYNYIPQPKEYQEYLKVQIKDIYQAYEEQEQLFSGYYQKEFRQIQEQFDSFGQQTRPARMQCYDNESDNDSEQSETNDKQSSTLEILRYQKKFQQVEFDADNDAIEQQPMIMLEYVISEFKRADYSYLFKRQEMLDAYIRKIASNWDFNKIIYQPFIKKLMDIIKAKIEFVSESKLIYQRIYLLVDFLEELLDYRGSRRQAKSEENVADFLYQHFVQELQQKSARNGVYYIRNSVNSDTRMSLNEYISKYPEFAEENWRDILLLTANYINERYHKELPKPFKLDPKKECNTYDCLGCARFFSINENVYFPERLKGLLALGGSCMRIEANRASVLEEICGLLNGGGGALLFNTELYYNNVFTRGEYVTEIQKEEIQQRLNTLLNFIYPKPKPTNVILTWVPMVDPKQPSDEKNPLSFVEGLYVARVMIRPTEGHITYYWVQEGAPIFSVREKSIEPSGKYIVKGRDIQKFIKQKFKKFEAECLTQDESLDKELLKGELPIAHKCSEPHLGKQISQPKVEIEKEQGKEHQKYQYASIVVAKKQFHETIRANLKKYNIDCVIRTPFEKLKLRGAANSSVLYHNTRFDELLGVVSYNNDFKFAGRYLLVILITPYIRLMERNRDNQMNQNDLKSLGVWLNREYPSETLSLWQFINESNELEYYISTCSRESSLYIYIVMTQFQEKSSFKNPKGLERLGKEERAKRFKKIYPK